MKSKKLLLTALVALAVPFGTLSGGLVKADEPSKASEDAAGDAWEKAANENIKPATQPGVTPQAHPTWNTETREEAKKAEDAYARKVEAEYDKLTATHTNGDALVNHKPEYKLPAAGQTPKKQVNPMNKNVKKALPKTSAVK
ncbi:hypothetical protein [Gemella sp.]